MQMLQEIKDVSFAFLVETVRNKFINMGQAQGAQIGLG
jgi:hypothetical protein